MLAVLLALALTITNVEPAKITSSQDIFTISASASGLSGSTQYLQIGFTKQDEPANYFGFIQNNSGEWTKYKPSPEPSEFSQFYSFTPNSGSWSGQLKAKIDPSDSGFKGRGVYNLKLFKYITSSASYSNVVTVDVDIAEPTPAPTLAPTPTPVPTSTPAPTKTSTPTLAPSRRPTFLPTPTASPSAAPRVLAASASAQPTSNVENLENIEEQEEASGTPWLFIILLLSGLGLLAVSGFLIFRHKKVI